MTHSRYPGGMHRARIFAFTLPVLCTLGACVAACEDSSNPNIAIALPEAGLTDTGPGTNPGVDGSVPDGAAPDAEAGAQGISVLIFDGLTPKSGVRVILHDATGAVTGETTTDATGHAASATTPSMVTVLTTESATSVNPVTYMGLTGGETLRVAVRHSFDEPAVLGTVSVTHTNNAALLTGATIFFSAFGPNCGNNGASVANPIAVTVYSNCVAANNSVLTTASDTNGNPLAFAFAKNVTAPAGNNTVNVGPLAFSDKGTRTIAATNLLDAEQYSNYVNGYAVSATSPFYIPQKGDINLAGGVTFTTPIGFADAFQMELDSNRGFGGFNSTTSIIRREAATTDATGALTSFDFNEALPFIHGISTTQMTQQRPAVTVTTAAQTGAHTGLVRIFWNGETNSGRWTFVFPGDQKTFTAPALPTDASAFAPNTDVGVDMGLYLDGPLVPDYGTAKKLPIPTDGTLDLLDSNIALPVNGKILVTTGSPGRG